MVSHHKRNSYLHHRVTQPPALPKNYKTSPSFPKFLSSAFFFASRLWSRVVSVLPRLKRSFTHTLKPIFGIYLGCCFWWACFMEAVVTLSLVLHCFKMMGNLLLLLFIGMSSCKLALRRRNLICVCVLSSACTDEHVVSYICLSPSPTAFLFAGSSIRGVWMICGVRQGMWGVRIIDMLRLRTILEACQYLLYFSIVYKVTYWSSSSITPGSTPGSRTALSRDTGRPLWLNVSAQTSFAR